MDGDLFLLEPSRRAAGAARGRTSIRAALRAAVHRRASGPGDEGRGRAAPRRRPKTKRGQIVSMGTEGKIIGILGRAAEGDSAFDRREGRGPDGDRRAAWGTVG